MDTTTKLNLIFFIISIWAGVSLSFLAVVVLIKKFVKSKFIFLKASQLQIKIIKTATLFTAILAAVPACAPPFGWMLAGGFGSYVGDKIGPSKAGKMLGFALGIATVPTAIILVGALFGLVIGLIISVFIRGKKDA